MARGNSLPKKTYYKLANRLKTKLKRELMTWLGVDEYELEVLYSQLSYIFDIDWELLSRDDVRQREEEIAFMKQYWGLSYTELQLLHEALRYLNSDFYSEEKIRRVLDILRFLEKH